MTNTSSTGGYLAPLGTPPAEDADLDALLAPVIVGVTGLDTTLVRPKWQPIPPAQPDRTVTWCAFGTSRTRSDTYPSIVHDAADNDGLGTSTEYRSEYLEVMASFYGPSCRAFATLLRDGLGVGQNREAMRVSGLAYVDMDPIVNVSDLNNQQYIRRADLVFRVNRIVARAYAIQNLQSIQGEITADSGSDSGQQDVISSISIGS